jgi:hypothetical protein
LRQHVPLGVIEYGAAGTFLGIGVILRLQSHCQLNLQADASC